LYLLADAMVEFIGVIKTVEGIVQNTIVVPNMDIIVDTLEGRVLVLV